jgi:hypothetical protein
MRYSLTYAGEDKPGYIAAGEIAGRIVVLKLKQNFEKAIMTLLL